MADTMKELGVSDNVLMESILHCILQGKEFFKWSDWDYLFTPYEVFEAFQQEGRVHTMFMVNTTVH
jgi:hypothetical protein